MLWSPRGQAPASLLAARARWLVAQGVDPEQILVLVFTRSAAASIGDKIGVRGVRCSTFHAYAASEMLGPGQRVACNSEEKAAREGLYNGRTALPPRKRPLGIKALTRATVEREATGGEDTFAQVETVLTRLVNAGLAPTWDLVPSWLTLHHEQRFAHVLLDEAQDATPAEWAMARRLSKTGEVFAVGDPRQAIFRFRFSADCDGWEPTHYLSQSFRFGATIAGHCNGLAPDWPAVEGLGFECEFDHDERAGLSPVMTRRPTDYFGALEVLPALDVILCRTHAVCAHVARELGDVAVHVRPDPTRSLDHPSDRFEIGAGWVLVTSAHAYKGLEADRVALVSTPRWRKEWGDGEEAWVRYVGASRARRLLVEVEMEDEVEWVR